MALLNLYFLVSLTIVIVLIDVTPHLKQNKVHELVTKHVKSRRAYKKLYEIMRLPALPVNMPLLAGIDLWLLTCPCSWRELAWIFYRCQLAAAVVDLKKIFLEGESIYP